MQINSQIPGGITRSGDEKVRAQGRAESLARELMPLVKSEGIARLPLLREHGQKERFGHASRQGRAEARRIPFIVNEVDKTNGALPQGAKTVQHKRHDASMALRGILCILGLLVGFTAKRPEPCGACGRKCDGAREWTPDTSKKMLSRAKKISPSGISAFGSLDTTLERQPWLRENSHR